MARYTAIALLFALAQVVACSAASHRAPQSYCGYNITKYKVTGGNGYITTVFRLDLMSYGIRGEQPVLLQHSFCQNADSWFQLGENSLPCLLAKAGYDVWVANARGTSYSQEHTSLDPDRDVSSYWDFGFHEMAVQDLPATIDRILQVTKRRYVSYVGHGMGGTMGFILLSELAAYNEKINMAVTFVPTCYTRASNNLRNAAHRANALLYRRTGTYPLPPTQINVDDKVLSSAMESLDFVFSKGQSEGRGGKAYGRDTMSRQSKGQLGKCEDTTSLRTIKHLCHLIFKERFQIYKEIQYIHQGERELYKLANIKTRQFIIYSDLDGVVNQKGAQELCKKLPKNVRECTQVQQSGFRHDDFLTNEHAKQYVYDVALRALHSQLNGSGECLVYK